MAGQPLRAGHRLTVHDVRPENAAPLLAVRYRLTADSDGFPMIPGRYGQVEYVGDEHGIGTRRLRVSTRRPRLIARLRALPALHAQQAGDREARFWFPAGSPALLTAVCDVIRARIRRRPTPASFQKAG